MQKETAWSADRLNEIEISKLSTEEAGLQVKKTILENAKEELVAHHATRDELEKNKEELDAILQKQKEINKEIKDRGRSAWGEFSRGAQESWQKQTDWRQQTQQLGSGIVNTGIDGLTNGIVSSLNTVTNPDKTKLAELRSQIAQAEINKSQLENDIKAIEGNTSKTPQEVKALNDKKIALDGINRSLDTQKQALKEQSNAWSSFVASLI